MKGLISAFVSGGLFGAGLLISQMINPEKVIGFLDIVGDWDPSLAFVMIGALVVTFLGYRFVLNQPSPAFSDRFYMPTAKDIDGALIGGAAFFGIGWGLSGLCPGPAIALSALGGLNVVYFLGGMVGAMFLFRWRKR